MPAANVARALGLANHIGHLRDIDRRACRQGFDVSDAVWPCPKNDHVHRGGEPCQGGGDACDGHGRCAQVRQCRPVENPFELKVWKSNSR